MSALLPMDEPTYIRCPKCSETFLRFREREGSGRFYACDKCRIEWSDDGLKRALGWDAERIAAEELSPSFETTATGATRSSAYPKGAKFPARYDLMMRNAAGMRRLAETWGEGFAKYGADNWLKGFTESQLISHITEHVRLHLAGDTSEDHAAHIAWNALALCWIDENKPELMDLTKPEQKL